MRKCVHNPLKALKLKRRAFKERLFKNVMAFAKQNKLPLSSFNDLRTFFSIVEGLKDGYGSWTAFRKAAKLVIQKFGYGTAATMKQWLTMFDSCLEVELGCSYPAEMKRLNREWHKNNPMPPIGKPIPPGPFTLENAKLIIDGDLTFDVSKAKPKKGGKK